MLPKEIWHLIFRYLSSTQTTPFIFVSKLLKDFTKDYMKSSQDFWKPLFNQLFVMPPYLNRPDPFAIQANNAEIMNVEKPDYEQLFKAAFLKAALQQQKEWASLALSDDAKLYQIPEKQKRQTGNLIVLTNRNKALDKINTENIKRFQYQTGILGYTYYPISRLPHHLKDDEKTKKFLNTIYRNIFIDKNNKHFSNFKSGQNFQLLPYGVDIDAVNERGETSLYEAVQKEDMMLIERFLMVKANINKPDLKKVTPIHAYIRNTAQQKFNLNFVKYLITECGAEVDNFDVNGLSPLFTLIYRAAFGQLEIEFAIKVIDCLVETKKCNVNLHNINGNTALHYAVMCAVREESKNCVLLFTYLIKKWGAALEAVNTVNYTPLMVAITKDESRSPEVTKDLLSMGANGRITDAAGLMPLHHIARYGRFYGHIASFIYSGIDVNTPTNDGTTALHYAVMHDNLNKVKFLEVVLEANVLALDDEGKTPLHYAAELGLLNVTQWLVEYTKSNLHIVDKQNQTPYDLAYAQGHMMVANYLKGKEIGLNALLKEKAEPIVAIFDRFCLDLSNALPSLGSPLEVTPKTGSTKTCTYK